MFGCAEQCWRIRRIYQSRQPRDNRGHIFIASSHPSPARPTPRAAPAAPQGANRSRFHPARSGVRGVFWARGMARSPLPARIDARRASNPSPALPLSGEGATGRARRRAGRGRDAGRARFPPAKGGQGGVWRPRPPPPLPRRAPPDACARVSKGLATPSLPCRPPSNAPVWGMKGIPPPSRGSPRPIDAPKRGTKGYPDTLPCPAPTLGCPAPGHRRDGRPLRRVSTTLPWVSATLRRAAAGLLWVSGTLRWVSATLPRVADTLFWRGAGQGERPAGRQRGGGRQSGPGHGRSCPGGSAGGRRPGGPQAAVPGSFLTMRGRRAG